MSEKSKNLKDLEEEKDDPLDLKIFVNDLRLDLLDGEKFVLNVLNKG